MEITVREFMDLSVDETWQNVTLYSVESGEDIFTGITEAMTDAMLDSVVCSFDIIDKSCPRLVLNIEFEED